MTDANQPPETASAETAAPQDLSASAQAAADPVEALTRENAELKDRLLRTLAEMENLRRRTEREIADGRTYAVTAFARDALGVSDNVRRALDATGPDWKSQTDAAGQALFEGVELIERELLKVMEKHGVKQLDPQGQKFDPNLHQAMYEVPDASVPAGTVVQVLQSGFTIGDRILRPALVGVSKGGPKTAPGETAAGTSQT
jgi:molecular chaperone GrpE